MSETETKFAVDRGRKAHVLSGLDGAGRSADFESLYFDTDDLALRQRRIELRLRRGNGEIVQKIKMRPDNGTLPGHESSQLALNDLQPNLDHLRTVLPLELRDAISRSALKPKFRADYTRTLRSLATGGSATAACFDDGFIEAMGRRGTICEVKLKGGSLDAHTETCLSFLNRVPAALLAESKGERGYGLAFGELPRPVNAQRLAVTRGTPLPQAILHVFRHGFHQFLANHPAVTRGGEPESIHQMRVGMRRLRSAVRMFGPVLVLTERESGFLEDLKALFGRLGQVREADVFMHETLPSIAAAGLGERLEAVMGAEIFGFRDGIHRKVHEELMSPNFARLAIQLNEWIEGARWLRTARPLDALLIDRAAEDFAMPRLGALCAKLSRKASKARRGTLEDWHRARITVKKLRYAGEPLIGAVADTVDTAKLLKQLSRLQNTLGSLNDLETMTPFLSRVQQKVRGTHRRDFEAAVQFCRGWAGATATSLVVGADQAMKDFETISLLGRQSF